MVNQTIFEYLRRYSPIYRVEDLKQKILSSGYSEKDFDEALLSLKSQETGKSDSEKSLDYSDKNSKWLKLGGICGIIILILAIISSLMTAILPQSSAVLSIILVIIFFISAISLIFFFYGFNILGKKYKKKLIRIISWILIILGILGIIFAIVLIVYPSLFGELIFTPLLNAVASDNPVDELLSVLGPFLVIILIIFFACLVLGILFSAGLIGLRNEVKYANIAGILNIIGLCTLILLVGFLILLVSFIFEIVLLMKEGKK